jgi:microcystin-dependent protein
MGSPYVGEIRMFPGNFAPVGWAFCNGQILSISQNTVLFDLIGTTYGGDGISTFALPDLQGRVPIHFGTGPGVSPYDIGESAGAETVTVTVAESPQHNHGGWAALSAPGTADKEKLPDGYLANGALPVYDNTPSPPTTPLASSMIASVGGGQPHENMAPFVAINFIISLFGIFPSQN